MTDAGRQNVTEWIQEMVARALTEQGRFVQSYGRAMQDVFSKPIAGRDPIGSFYRFAATEVAFVFRGSMVATLLYYDALLAAARETNNRFQDVVAEVDSAKADTAE